LQTDSRAGGPAGSNQDPIQTHGWDGIFPFQIPLAVMRFSISSSGVPKWFKFIAAILLLPVCSGAAAALGKVVQASGGAVTIWVPMAAGAVCWLVVFLLLPKPMLIYVFGHELTHAVWTWLFGGRVKRFKATSSGGHVLVTKTNFLIGLAPYFFPLYAVLVVIGFAIGNQIWGWQPYLVWFHLLIGAAYSFHVTLTWHILQTQQSDITQQGWLFSAVIIWLGNLSVLLVGIPALTAQVSLSEAFGWWWQASRQAVEWLWNLT
jgi:hypothetical protein